MNLGAKFLTVVILLTDWSVGGEVVRQPAQCTVDGVTYDDGASWPSLDGCQQCRCSSGLTFCVRVSFCRDLGQCGVAITPPGSCCPVCYGCVSPSGKKVSLNETWMEDDCTTCVCRDGQTKCQASFCRTPCLYPRKVPGECCPVCDDDCHLQCNYGRVVDSSGRELCQCRKVPDEDFRDLSAVTIRRKEEDDSEEEDEDYVTSVNNSNNENEAISCPKVPCKKMCTHGFQTDGRGCPVCKCQRCPSIQPCHKKCPLGLIHDSRGCPACQCRSSTTTPAPRTCAGPANQTYNYGDKWTNPDDCTECVCNQEGSSCTKVDCPLSCLNAVFISGQCCPVCDDESSTVGHQNRNIIEEDGMSSRDGTALLTAILVCVSLVAGLILIVAVLAFCVARQCQRLRLHEENMASAAAAAVKLTAVNRLRPKSTNLDYQYNLYLHRYRETSPNCWTPLDVTDRSDDSSESRGDRDEGVGDSQCSNTSLLLVKSNVE